MKKKTKILIIGGTGFIGYHLARKCLNLNWKVESISLNNPKKIRNLSNVKYYKCDISHFNKLSKILKNKNFSYVVNLGGYVNHKNNKLLTDGHLRGLKNILKIFKQKKIKKFIQIGSSSEYGLMRSPHNEKFIGHPKTIYGKIKLSATNHLIKFAKKTNLNYSILRFYQIYGPHQDFNRFIPQLINACIKKVEFLTSHGKQLRDFLYVDDAISAIFKVFDNDITKGKIINIGSGKPIKLIKIINLVKNKIGGGKIIRGKIKLRKDEHVLVYPNINNAKKLLRWHPKISFKTGLRKTINYYKKNLKI